MNGDRVYWTVETDGSFTKANMDKNAIGAFVYTKALGSNFRDDVTYEYKHPEGTLVQSLTVYMQTSFDC